MRVRPRGAGRGVCARRPQLAVTRQALAALLVRASVRVLLPGPVALALHQWERPVAVHVVVPAHGQRGLPPPLRRHRQTRHPAPAPVSIPALALSPATAAATGGDRLQEVQSGAGEGRLYEVLPGAALAVRGAAAGGVLGGRVRVVGLAGEVAALVFGEGAGGGGDLQGERGGREGAPQVHRALGARQLIVAVQLVNLTVRERR